MSGGGGRKFRSCLKLASHCADIAAGGLALILKFLFLTGIVSVSLIRAQSADFTVEGLPVQVHGFASQAFLVSNQNNYLTMPTGRGSLAFTDFGGNISVQITGKFRVGAQVYDRNMGELGNWAPELDWASGDYRFKDWFGIRAGKVKTVMGLDNDTQDLDSLHTWALLPQSVYPLDLRGTRIAHVGGDFYGDITLQRLGSLSYTAWAGLIPNDPNGGRAAYNSNRTRSARSEGGDLRWNTPLSGFLAGVSYINSDWRGMGIDALGLPYTSRTKEDGVSQFYVQYAHNGLTLAAEYRRAYADELIFDVVQPAETWTDSRSFYGSASYRISKRVEIGSYYSRFYGNWVLNLSDPANHIFDKVATLRLDLTSHWDAKIEGHFMNGYADSSLRGFYIQDNPRGLKPNTNLLVIRTGIQF